MTSKESGGKRDVNAQLGCGTLILIAIIVVLFSGRGDIRDARDEIGALRDQVTRLETKIRFARAAARGEVKPQAASSSTRSASRSR